LVVGSLDGRLKQAFAKVAAIHAKHGPFDLMLCTGDLFGPDPDQQVADLEALLSRSLTPPLPTYFVSGRHPIAPKVAEIIDRSDGQVTDSLTYLGSSGIMTTPEKLRIAFLSGAFNKQPAGVDILLTVNWPDNITALSPLAAAKFQGRPPARGIRVVADVDTALAPRYHFAASESLFFEREPFYISAPGVVHPTRFIGLGSFGAANKERWFYAMNIVPLATIDGETLRAKPPVLTENPLRAAQPRSGPHGHDRLAGAGQKRPNEADGGSYFWGSPADQDPNKRQRTPPNTYVCNKCKEPGHWIQDCPLVLAEQNRPREQPEGYVCRICNKPGHNIRDCPDAGSNKARGDRRVARNDPIAQRDSNQCWFCLSNPNLEQHLIVAIVSETYVTLSKGGLVPGHLLVVPVGHFQSTRSMQLAETAEEKETAASTFAEMMRVRSVVCDAQRESGHVIVTFEVFAGGDSANPHEKLHHLHVQLVPLPADMEGDIEAAFVHEAETQGLDLVDELPEAVYMPYLRVQLPNDKVLVFAPSVERYAEYEQQMQEAQRGGGRRPPRIFNLQIGRLVIAKLIGKPERADWKQCILSLEQETAEAAELQTRLAF
ncbi:CwfJ C-terminus 1-domain-containing protein-like protein, partial [Entophlyctis helioformis]